MTVGFVGFHYPHSEDFDEFVGRAHQVREALQAGPGCVSAEVWATPDGDAVVTTARFESHEALQQGFAAAGELGAAVEFDERERKPRQIFTLLAR